MNEKYSLTPLRWMVLIASVAWMTGACAGQDATAPMVADPARVYAELRLNYKAVVMSLEAPYNTVDLQAVPLNLLGDTLSVNERPVFSRVNSLDTSIRVDSMGRITAQAETNGTRVMVQQKIGQVTRTDVVTIMVRGEIPAQPITRIEFFPLPPDSNWRWAGERTSVRTSSWVRLFNENGDTIPSSRAVVHTWAKDIEVFGVGSEYPRVWSIVGDTYVYASVYAYGKLLVDSVLFRRIDPPLRSVVIDRVVPVDDAPYHAFFPSTIVAKPGTTIAFMNRFGTKDTWNERSSATAGWWEFGENRIIHLRRFLDQSPPTTGVLFWVDSVDINFDMPELVEAADTYGSFALDVLGGPISPDGNGNIAAFAVTYCTRTGARECAGYGAMRDSGVRYRKFSTPGTYRFWSTRFPKASGTIIITEEPIS